MAPESKRGVTVGLISDTHGSEARTSASRPAAPWHGLKELRQCGQISQLVLIVEGLFRLIVLEALPQPIRITERHEILL